ncbi:hypothetical protein B4082_2047 [Bacillus cereus]|uniref:Uncharacterized protein n=1 Tax=Bacillus cereus TaxID=1396 RepID=A0A164G523_BACCE|nr:hypothetical protein B4082_2047 [Bacillus cereus]
MIDVSNIDVSINVLISKKGEFLKTCYSDDVGIVYKLQG